jgi:tetratricopeptide (TPR) repeat protein
VRQELMSLPKTLADDVARNLVMVAQLIDEDPEQAYAYSRVALRLASRVAAVREAAGFAAYATQKYAEALAEFRAARRMTGNVDLWPVMADCERGLGRPERALAMAGEPEVQKLDKAGQVEMRLVAAGARRDMGQLDAAIVTLQSPELASHAVHPWTARLRYAYADALLAEGRESEAREWFARANEADKDGSTDASDRLAELDGIEFVDAMDDEEGGGDGDIEGPAGPSDDAEDAGADAEDADARHAAPVETRTAPDAETEPETAAVAEEQPDAGEPAEAEQPGEPDATTTPETADAVGDAGAAADTGNDASPSAPKAAGEDD